ncbi:MAG: hypothetical protein JWL78_753 [Chloroflexi bacterium]|jgi:hypothetical protein|nr:hypothetical protein [Chloroflexota bacterium]MEA2616619.1 hypothetical protein [Chloroflexota bacterium]
MNTAANPGVRVPELERVTAPAVLLVTSAAAAGLLAATL